jgi:hypothetical protein
MAGTVMPGASSRGGPRPCAAAAQQGPDSPGPARSGADGGVPGLRLAAVQVGVLAGLVGTGQIAAHARACLIAVRPERDWFRQAVAKLEAAGERIVQTEQPGRNGDAWVVLDWRTGQELARIGGGQDAYDAAWRDHWTDVAWIGSWLEDLAADGSPAAEWPEALPPPPGIAELTATTPPLDLPGLPASLRTRLEDAIEEWTVLAGVVEGRVSAVARLTGWTEDQVLACAASYLNMTGERFMALGAAGALPEAKAAPGGAGAA